MKRVVLMLVFLIVLAWGTCSTAFAYGAPYAHISNMSLEVWLESGDWPAGPYPYWRQLVGPSTDSWTLAERMYQVSPEPAVGVQPYITGGGDANGFWVNFDKATSPASVSSLWVLGIYRMSKFRAAFDCDIYRLSPGLQLQIWIRRYRGDVLVWNSTQSYQTGHVATESDVVLDPYSHYEVVLGQPVPEPTSLFSIGLVASCAGIGALRKRWM
jgi:hypothetical protein